MTTTTPAQLKTLELASYTTLPRGEDIAPPTTFLLLTPATSASFPANPMISSPRSNSIASSSSVTSPAAKNGAADPLAAVVGPDSTAGSVIAEAVKNRRSSSTVNSESAGSVKQRFLKLGPVHWGEDIDGKGDWADVE